MAYKPVQIGQIHTNQIGGYTAKVAEIVTDDDINKLYVGASDGKLKGVVMDSEKGVANGVATLNAEGKIDESFLVDNRSDYELIQAVTLTSKGIFEITNLSDYDFFYIVIENIKPDSATIYLPLTLIFNNYNAKSTEYKNLLISSMVSPESSSAFWMSGNSYTSTSEAISVAIKVNVKERLSESFLTHSGGGGGILSICKYVGVINFIQVGFNFNASSAFRAGATLRLYGKRGGVIE